MCVRDHGKRGTGLSGEMAQNPGKESRRSERRSRHSGEALEGKGAAPRDPGQAAETAAVGVCLGVSPPRGPEGGAGGGRARELSSPSQGVCVCVWGGGSRRVLGGRGGGGAGRPNAPGAGCSRDAAEERPV